MFCVCSLVCWPIFRDEKCAVVLHVFAKNGRHAWHIVNFQLFPLIYAYFERIDLPHTETRTHCTESARKNRRMHEQSSHQQSIKEIMGKNPLAREYSQTSCQVRSASSKCAFLYNQSVSQQHRDNAYLDSFVRWLTPHSIVFYHGPIHGNN